MSGLLLRAAKRWVAGATPADALARTRASNQRGIGGIINLLGEQVTNETEIQAAAAEYLWLLHQIQEERLDSTISIKPTQLGMTLQQQLYHKLATRIAEEAHALHNFLWIDMENSPYTQATLDTYVALRSSFDNVGVAIQAYLRRTAQDLEGLLAKGGKVRLVKGAYRESSAIALKSRKETTVNYGRLMTMLFEHGDHFAIATHDDTLIDRALELGARRRPRFEFQMLLGVRDNLKEQLVGKGFRLSEYIPYGRNWLPYSIRRLRERKRDVWLLFRSLFGG